MVGSVMGARSRVERPGSKLPEGVDPNSVESVKAWLATFSEGIAAKAAEYSGILVGMGFDSLYALEFEAEDIVCETLPKGHARAIASNALAIRKRLGYGEATEAKTSSKVERGDPPSLIPPGGTVSELCPE